MQEDNQLGIVYVLKNAAMPDLVKIGKTSRDNVEVRLGELYSTGVPVPFECVFAGRVSDESAIEKAFHQAFGPYRLNPKREFFQIEPEQAIALLKLLVEEDVTPSVQHEAEQVDRDSQDSISRLNNRRPVMNFFEMGIPEGGQLVLSDGSERCTVISERKVEYQGKSYFLTTLTRTLVETSVVTRPRPQWEYEGQRLNDIYDDTYQSS